MGLPMAVFIDCFLEVCLLAYHLGVRCSVAVCLNWRRLYLMTNKLDNECPRIFPLSGVHFSCLKIKKLPC